MKFKAEIKVILKDGIKDSHGLAVESVLKSTNIDSNVKIKTGKYYLITTEAENIEAAINKINKICNSVLMNPEHEKYELISIDEIKNEFITTELAS